MVAPPAASPVEALRVGLARLWRQTQRHRAARELEAWLPPGPSRARVLVAEREPTALLAALATAWWAGADCYVGDPQWSPEQWQQALRQVRPQVLSVGGLPAATVRAWGDLVEAEPSALGRTRVPFARSSSEGAAAIAPDAFLAARILLATGGTGGRVRFVVHTAATLAEAAAAYLRHFGLPRAPAFICLPPWHASGLLPALRAIASGAAFRWWPWEKLAAGQFPTRLPRHTSLSLVPTQLARLLALPDRAATDAFVRSLAVVPIGGAALDPALAEAARARRWPLAPSFGATETAGMVAAVRPADFLAGDASAGTPLPHARLALRPGDVAPEPPAPADTGLLVVHATSLGHGYAGEPPADWAATGWPTADRARLDPAGRLWPLGRADRVLNSGGEKIDADLVETAFRHALPELREVFAFALPDPTWGEAIAVALAWPAAPSQPETDAAPAPSDAVAHHLPAAADNRAPSTALAAALPASLPADWRARLAPYLPAWATPKVVLALTALPRTAAGKLATAELRALAEARRAAGGK